MMISVEKNQKPLAIKRRRRRRRSKRDSEIEIPNDLVEEILLRLPVISLARFHMVSKQWRSLIRTKECFGERYMARERSKDPQLLFVCDDLVTRSKNTLYIKTVTLGETTDSLWWSLKFRKFRGFLEISESCDGLVCIHDMTIRVKVMSPASRLSIALPLARIQQLHIDHPNPELEIVEEPLADPGQFRNFTRFGFGKDSVTGRYKLVWLYNKYPATATSSTICEVLDLEDKKWRLVDTSATLDRHHYHVLHGQRPAFANGSFYWLTGDDEGFPTTQTKLIVFDIHTEMFQVIPAPPFISCDAAGDKVAVCNLDGRLCISELKGDCKQEFWWRNVKDDNTWEWDKIFSVDVRFTSTWFLGITSQPLTPLTISKDTNKVILSLTYQDNLVAMDLDPHSTVYHLYFSGYYGLAVPYFPSLLLSSKTDPCL